MKKIYIAALFFMFCIFVTSITTNASDSIIVTISGEPVSFTNQKPDIVDGRVLVPLRDVFETLGFRVDWNPNAQIATLQNVNYEIIVEIGSNVFTTNGESFELDSPAQIIDGRTMLPLRLILESLGFNVAWDADANTVAVTTEIWLDIVPVPISTYAQSSFAIRNDGSLWAWGCNRFGKLGDGTVTLTGWDENYTYEMILDNNDRAEPVRIMGNVAAVFAGGSYTMAITNDGELWAWGNNQWGQLGDGTMTSRLNPVKIMDNVVTVSTSSMYALAVRTDGSLWAWGSNIFGQFGNGIRTGIEQSTPVRIMEDVISVSSGTDHVLAIRSDGSLWAWGLNSFGQLGNGTSNPSDADIRNNPGFGSREIYAASVPEKIMDGVISATATESRSMAVSENGGLYIWGWDNGSHINSHGDSAMYLSSPTRIIDDARFATQNNEFIARTYVITEDGTLIANESLRNLRGEYLRRFLLEETLGNVVFVSADTNHTLAITEDGSLWAWGLNDRGQLGNGTNNTSIAPIRIMGNIMLPFMPF
ncbi:MAG: stalk domain-containing protein [Defluviitaleaceae bacterium]|nr:stalk domain-containing protein [Defluviitaleaceae bacterium]